MDNSPLVFGGLLHCKLIPAKPPKPLTRNASPKMWHLQGTKPDQSLQFLLCFSGLNIYFWPRATTPNCPWAEQLTFPSSSCHHTTNHRSTGHRTTTPPNIINQDLLIGPAIRDERPCGRQPTRLKNVPKMQGGSDLCILAVVSRRHQKRWLVINS